MTAIDEMRKAIVTISRHNPTCMQVLIENLYAITGFTIASKVPPKLISRVTSAMECLEFSALWGMVKFLHQFKMKHEFHRVTVEHRRYIGLLVFDVQGKNEFFLHDAEGNVA